MRCMFLSQDVMVGISRNNLLRLVTFRQCIRTQFSVSRIRSTFVNSYWTRIFSTKLKCSKSKQFLICLSTPDFNFLFFLIYSSECPNCTGIYIPPHCEKSECATLLAPLYNDTEFVRHHIDELKLYVNVIWLGVHLKPVIDDYLFPMFEQRFKDNGGISKKFLILHRFPSEIINTNVEYEMITMPRCEDMISNRHTNCKYESMPLLKYYTAELTYSNALFSSFLKLDFEESGLRRVFELYDNTTRQVGRARSATTNKNAITKYPNQLKDNLATYDKNIKNGRYMNKLYNEIACKWMKQSEEIYDKWFNVDYDDDEEVIHIGGIFPITAAGPAYSGRFTPILIGNLKVCFVYDKFNFFFLNISGLLPAVSMAETAINLNPKILPNIRLNILKMDGKCQADQVMKAFINIYMNQGRVLGVLGPACSETVEPIAGE